VNSSPGDGVTAYRLVFASFGAILVAEEKSSFCGRGAMFLKRLERRKSGKKHIYWALVQSLCTARSSRHQVVAYPGELKKSDHPPASRAHVRRGAESPVESTGFGVPQPLRRIDEVESVNAADGQL
jgi:hypothetical protein